MPPEDKGRWCPFRPTNDDLESIGKDVAEIPTIQQRTLSRDHDLKFPDRVAHQYQIAGGKVLLKVANEPPVALNGIGLFQPGAEYIGVGRISTGLGTPHVENMPDFLGIRVAFQTKDKQRVDFIGINHPASPADDHHDFMTVLHATGEAAGVEIPFVGKLGDHDLINLGAQQTAFSAALIRRMGLVRAGRSIVHLTSQTVRTSLSSTAYQAYWTGIAEVGGTGGKFTFVPVRDENHRPGFSPGERHFTKEWRARQAAGDIEFLLYWIPYIDEEKTPTTMLTHAWTNEDKQLVGQVVFPRTSPDSEEACLWAVLASEMGANPGNWIADRDNTIKEPATDFGNARKIAYRKSQEGRGALEAAAYQGVFDTGEISAELAQELRTRRDKKASAKHVGEAPRI